MTNSTISAHKTLRDKWAAAICLLAISVPSQLSPHSAGAPHLNTPPYMGEPDARAAIAVFTGDNARIAEGLKLYMQGHADYLIISGHEMQNQNIASMAARLKIIVTRNLDGITLDPAPINTCDSAISIAKWVKDNQIDYVMGVTSDYHAQRVNLLLQSALPHGTGINIWPVPSNAGPKTWESERIKITATQLGLCNIPGYQIPGL